MCAQSRNGAWEEHGDVAQAFADLNSLLNQTVTDARLTLIATRPIRRFALGCLPGTKPISPRAYAASR